MTTESICFAPEDTVKVRVEDPKPILKVNEFGAENTKSTQPEFHYRPKTQTARVAEQYLSYHQKSIIKETTDDNDDTMVFDNTQNPQQNPNSCGIKLKLKPYKQKQLTNNSISVVDE